MKHITKNAQQNEALLMAVICVLTGSSTPTDSVTPDVF